MFNKFTLVVIAGIGVSVAANMLDQKFNGRTDNASATQSSDRSAPARQNRQRVAAITAGRNGQFSASTLANGIHVEMLADTGATLVVLTAEDAERIGIDLEWLDFDVPVQTANGQAMNARIILDHVNVGGIEIRDVDALVAKPGQLSHSLLGMSFLRKLTKFEIKGDQLVLHY